MDCNKKLCYYEIKLIIFLNLVIKQSYFNNYLKAVLKAYVMFAKVKRN